MSLYQVHAKLSRESSTEIVTSDDFCVHAPSQVALVQNMVVNCGQIRNGMKKLEASGILAEVLERHPRGGS